MEETAKNHQLGRYVREQRTARGLSGQALALAAGVDKSWLHRLEHGEYASPDPHLLVRLARALEVDVADLYVAAGLPTGRELPSMRPYLRAKYDLPEHAIQQIAEYVDMLNDRYGSDKEDDDDQSAARTA
jgi:transcriptional regulator with XRE-family HTH domain